ncbi:hypothetical protein [Bacteroides ihuae]|uniref:hypothetical protein n=1 Tax=Bacteroides ihuae TaxID=1852362 RepID=UPI0008D989A2|nr:hypothetical protein [Bacteroides ihuae]
MVNRWKLKDIPHKGWILENVYDVRKDGQSKDETIYENCMMCGHEKIRYVHVIVHPDIIEQYLVGCQCASKLTGDYETSRCLERKLKKKATQRTNFLRHKWIVNRNGNKFLKMDSHYILIYENVEHKYAVKIDKIWGKQSFETIERAKGAAFKGIEFFKENGMW